MATANAITSADYKIEYSANGTTGWVDWSTFVTQIDSTDGDVALVLLRTFADNVPDILRGKKNTLKATLKCVYTEAAAEPGDVLYTAQDTGVSVYLRASPRGGQTGEQQFTSSQMFVKSGAIHPPSATAEGSEALMFDVSVEFKSWTKADAA